jgi:hypothetical protein
MAAAGASVATAGASVEAAALDDIASGAGDAGWDDDAAASGANPEAA